MTVTIRRASDDDADAVVACLADAFEPYRAAYTPGGFADTVPTAAGMRTRMQDTVVFIAEEAASGSAVGTVGCREGARGTGHIRGMGVRRDAQRLGVAGRLLAAAEAELRAAGCQRITLDTTEPLQRAAAFYRRAGYVPTGQEGDFFGMRLIEYAKDLLR